MSSLPVAGLPAARLPDWQRRLADLVAARWHAPFAWGVHDCCLWAADAVLACTGHDPAADLRGRYATAEQAARLLQRLGGVEGIAVARAGPVVPAALAQIGDVGLLVADPARPALAVCGGAHWLAPGAQGMSTHPASAVTRAWRCTAGAEGGVRA